MKNRTVVGGCLGVPLLLIVGVILLDSMFGPTPERRASIERARQEDARFKERHEQADRKAEAKRLAAAKAAEFELLERSSKLGQFGNRLIVGRIRNTSGEDKSYVSVTFTLLNDADEKVGTAFANVSGLAAGEVWAFEAAILQDATTKYKLEKIEGH